MMKQTIFLIKLKNRVKNHKIIMIQNRIKKRINKKRILVMMVVAIPVVILQKKDKEFP